MDMLACTDRSGRRCEITRHPRIRFYTFYAAYSVPEIGTLETTITTWQDPMIRAISTALSNARSENYDPAVKHVGRIAFGVRTPDNQRRRRRWARIRQSRQVRSSTRPQCPARSEEPGVQLGKPRPMGQRRP